MSKKNTAKRAIIYECWVYGLSVKEAIHKTKCSQTHVYECYKSFEKHLTENTVKWRDGERLKDYAKNEIVAPFVLLTEDLEVFQAYEKLINPKK